MDMTPSPQHWQAVMENQPRSDFVYAVTSTGIYCLPSCPSRKPRPEHVRFYRLPELAEQAGFRACKRCKPRHAKRNSRVDKMRAICRYIEAHTEVSLTLADLGEAFHLSPSYLQRSFKEVVGVSPQKYLEMCREHMLKRSLRAGESISQASFGAGFNSSSQVYGKALLGMTPRRYQQGGKAVSITFTIHPCALGFVLIAASDKGICSVTLGGSPEALEATLRAEFHQARITADDGQLEAWMTIILEHLLGKQPHLDLPLDVQATAFQKQVWEALKTIPYGETRTYAAVARQLGTPTASRAVASACASNPTALLVPCHRVVRSDGGLSGYRWGVERKAWLLEQEQQKASGLFQTDEA